MIENEKNEHTPSRELNKSWICSSRKDKNYPLGTIRGGKWLIFVERKLVDSLWEKIKSATECGFLGKISKVSTALESVKSKNKENAVICVYTYDSEDREDVFRIREYLTEIGITEKIGYKTNTATQQNKYSVNGDSKICMYFQ